MHTRFHRLLFLLLIFVLIFPSSVNIAAAGAAAGRPFATEAVTAGSVTILPGGNIDIAVAMFYGFSTVQNTFDAVEMALDDVGTIKGFSLRKIHYDIGCSESEGASGAAAIAAEPQIVGVIGPLCSSSTHGAAPVFETAGLVMISPLSTSPVLASDGPTVFNRVVLADPLADDWLEDIDAFLTVQDWKTRFEQAYGRQPDGYAHLSYDATRLLLKQIETVSELDGSNLVIDRLKLASAVRNTTGFPGISGLITLDIHGNRVDTRSQRVWSEDFSESTLAPEWSWVEEDSTHWSLNARPGFLRLVTQAETKNSLLQVLPEGDFEVRARMLFKPVENFQFAGIQVYLDDQNTLSFGREFCNVPAPACVGNGIYFDLKEAGVLVGSNFATQVADEENIYLRMVRTAGVYTGYASVNGAEWIEIGSHIPGFSPNRAGFFAHNKSQPASEIPADFDDFVIISTWHQLRLPVIIR